MTGHSFGKIGKTHPEDARTNNDKIITAFGIQKVFITTNEGVVTL